MNEGVNTARPFAFAKTRTDRMKDENDLRSRVARQCEEWGLRESDDKYGEFFEKCVREINISTSVEISSTFYEIFEPSSVNDFPRVLEFAVKKVLRKDLQDVTKSTYTQELLDPFDKPWPPFQIRVGETTYTRSHGYEKEVTDTELYPFSRFRFVTLTNQRHIYNNWTDTNSLGGTVMEALIAHYVVHNKSCFSCKRIGGLRWHGGRDDDSSWTDLLCNKCNSTYEIKSKKDHATLAKIFRKMSRYDELLPGGSFRKFYTNHLGLRHGKRFVILVSRLPKDKKVTLFISEIDFVQPTLEGKTFATYSANRTLFLGSKIKLKRLGTSWCCIFYPPEFAQKSKLWAKEVYEEEFGAGSWDAEGAAVAKTSSLVRNQQTTKREAPVAAKQESMASLKAELQQLHVSDNWDSSDDDDGT